MDGIQEDIINAELPNTKTNTSIQLQSYLLFFLSLVLFSETENHTFHGTRKQKFITQPEGKLS